MSLGKVDMRRYSSLARRVKAGTCKIKMKPFIKYPQKKAPQKNTHPSAIGSSALFLAPHSHGRWWLESAEQFCTQLKLPKRLRKPWGKELSEACLKTTSNYLWVGLWDVQDLILHVIQKCHIPPRWHNKLFMHKLNYPYDIYHKLLSALACYGSLKSELLMWLWCSH